MQSDNILLEKFISEHPGEAIKLVEKQSQKTIRLLIASLPIETSAKLFGHMNFLKAAQLLQSMDHQTATDLLERVPTQIVASVFRLLENGYRDQLLSEINPEKKSQIVKSLSFPTDAIGAHMDPKVFTLDHQLSINECQDQINSHHEGLGNQILIVDQFHKIAGYVRLQELMLASPNRKIISLIRIDFPSILADARISDKLIEDIISNLNWNHIPVVDAECMLLGVINKVQFSKVKPKDDSSVRQAWRASGALAELYQIGLTGLFRATND